MGRRASELQISADILELRTLSDTLVIGPRVAFGRGGRQALDSEDEIRRRFLRLLADPGSAQRLRRFCERWGLGGDGFVYASDRDLIERLCGHIRRGRLTAYVVPNTQLQTVRRPDVMKASLALNRPQPHHSAAAAPRTGPSPHPLAPVSPASPGLAARGLATRGPAPPVRIDVAALSLEQRLAEVLRRTSPLLPADLRAEFEKLIDPAMIATTVAVMAVWAGSHAVGIGFIADAILLGVSIFFAGWAVLHAVEATHRLIGLVLEARGEEDLDEAAKLLAKAIEAIGIRPFVLAIERGAQRVSAGKAARSR